MPIANCQLLTQGLDIVLVEGTLDVFDHQTRLADLRVADHADLDHHAVVRRAAVVGIVGLHIVEGNAIVGWDGASGRNDGLIT